MDLGDPEAESGGCPCLHTDIQSPGEHLPTCPLAQVSG